MTTPDILETAGFKPTKVGSGEKELGYVIEKSRLGVLVLGTLLTLGVVAGVAVWSQFEITLEKRSMHRQLRKEEHHAASKLAGVEMELWAHYREDIQESHEAHALLRNLNQSYGELSRRLQEAINGTAKELSLSTDKALHLADKILHLVADTQKDNIHSAKKLVDHLVASGKKSVALERHMEREVKKEVQHEEKHLEEDKAAGEDISAEMPDDVNESHDSLKGILEGFWFTFHDYEREFSGKARETLREGNPTYTKLAELKKKIESDDPPSEEEIGKALDTMDLDNVGAGLGSGRVLPAEDIVEELLMIPKLPTKQLEELEKEWRAGKMDEITVMEKLQEMHEKKMVPSGWLQKGVGQEENVEEEEEEKLEKEEEEEEEKEGKDGKEDD